MSAVNDCCSPCVAVQSVAIPGVSGEDGQNGAAGAPGVNAFSVLTANLTVPNAGQTVTAQMESTEWLVIGLPVYIAGPANFTVSSISSPTSAILRFSSQPGDLVPGSIILAGSGISVGSNSVSAYTTTIADFLVPAVGATVNISVGSTKWMGVGQQLLINGTDVFTVTSITDDNTFVGTYADVQGNVNSGNNIVAGSTVVVVGLDGNSGYSTTTSPTTIPAVGANVTVDLVSSDFMAIGQIVILSEDGTPAIGNFQVVSFPDAQSAVLEFLGYPGDSAPGVIIATGARASIAGILQSTSIGTLAVYGAGTAYDLTTTPALIGMGTTTPSLVISSPGTYLLLGSAVYATRGLDTGPAGTYTMQINRTNNTPALVANSADSFTQTNGAGGAATNQSDIPFRCPPVVYTTVNSNDIVQLWASISALPGTGTPRISSCSLVALKLA